jgi:hypothetical protein
MSGFNLQHQAWPDHFPNPRTSATLKAAQNYVHQMFEFTGDAYDRVSRSQFNARITAVLNKDTYAMFFNPGTCLKSRVSKNCMANLLVDMGDDHHATRGAFTWSGHYNGIQIKHGPICPVVKVGSLPAMVPP